MTTNREEREAHAIDGITEILHAYCERGDELEAEDVLRRAKMRFLRESDEDLRSKEESDAH